MPLLTQEEEKSLEENYFLDIDVKLIDDYNVPDWVPRIESFSLTLCWNEYLRGVKIVTDLQAPFIRNISLKSFERIPKLINH